MSCKRSSLFLFVFAAACFAQTAAMNRYAVILEDPPVSERFTTREATESVSGTNYRREIEAKQQSLRSELAARNFTVTGSVTLLTNAIFVLATPQRVDELKSLPGVKGVVPLRRYRLKLN